MKSYTDLEQSKKLAEFLPLESADYTRLGKDKDNVLTRNYFESYSSALKEWIGKAEIHPCWSLAALLNVLPMITKGKDTANPFIAKTPDNEYYVVYATLTKEVESSAIYDNPVDACCEMIIRLHELNLLGL